MRISSLLGLSSVGLICAAIAPTFAAKTVANAPKWSPVADGFATVNALGQNGTTGGAGGEVVTVATLAELEKYAASPLPYVIRIQGTIAKVPFGKNINVASNKTLIGVGKDATLLHGELHLDGVSNVIIRNLTIRDSWVEGDPGGKKHDFDAIQIDNSHHIWIDHCHLMHMEDGLIDLRKDSDYITVSWTILSDHDKVFGIGWGSTPGKRHVTIHHLWIRDTVQRNPSFDNGTGHLYNNWLQNISTYGNYSRGTSKMVVENSVFERVQNPLQCSDAGELVSRGNILRDSPGRNEARGKAFDPRGFYAYTLDSAQQLPAILRAGAGPQESLGR